MKTVIAIYVLVLISGSIHAQTDKDASWKLLAPKDSSGSVHSTKQPLMVEQKSDSIRKPGTITIQQDEKIDGLIETYNKADKLLSGYRVQIFLGKPKEAQKMRVEFISKYPDIPAYEQWQSPNMKIRIGDLRTRLDAERALKMIQVDYPGAYIVEDFIELPDLDAPIFEIEEN